MHIYSSWSHFYDWFDSSNVASFLFPASFVMLYNRYEAIKTRDHYERLHRMLREHISTSLVRPTDTESSMGSTPDDGLESDTHSEDS